MHAFWSKDTVLNLDFLFKFGFSEKRFNFFHFGGLKMAIFQIKILKVLVHSGSVAIGCVIFSTSVQDLTSLAYVNDCLKISANCVNLVVLWILKLIFFITLW